MKKWVYICICLLLAFTACNQQEELPQGTSLKSETKANHFYGVKRSGEAIQTKGVAQRTNLWYPGSEITVKFLDGSETYKEKVMTYVAEWEDYANITFRFVTEENANVRIGFDWNADRWITWSYIGTDCKIVTNQSDATMSFADWAYKTEQERKGDVLRAFGQVLGLELEHRHLDFDANWTTRIASYWEGEIEDIPWETLKVYVFDPLLASNVIMTEEYDENSIMIWPFTSRYAGNTARTFNNELSEMDKVFIGQLYPKGEEPILSIRYIGGGTGYSQQINSPVTVDWGNGRIESFNPPSFTYREDNLIEGEYIAKIYGAPDAITEFEPTRGIIVRSIIVGKNSKLETIYSYIGHLIYYDFSEAKSLKTLNLYGNNANLEPLDISFFPKLEYLSTGGVGLTILDLSNNVLLRTLYCSNNQLTSLDLSSIPNIEFIQIRDNPIVSDEIALLNMVESLPNRTGETEGLLYYGVNFPSVSDICRAKNWTVN